MPLRRRLFVLSAVAILPLALMAGIGLYALERQQRQQTERIGLELSRSVANAVDGELRSAIAVLETLATSPTLDRDDRVGFMARAERVRRLTPGWTAVVLSAPDGSSRGDTRAGRPGSVPRPLDRESFDRVVHAKTPTTGDLVRGSEGEWLFAVRVPVVRDEIVKFVLSALVSPEAIRGLLTRQRVPSDWVISIVDGAGRRVARSRAHEENLGGPLSETVGRLVATGAAEGFGVAYSLEGERIFTPYTRLHNGWIAVLGLPTALADAAAYRALAIYGGGILLSIALGGAGAFWVAATIARPIDALRKAASFLGRGEAVISPNTTIPEIREVAAALTLAAEDLARSEARREELLRTEHLAREAAESADRAKDQFMAVLSHELRTPLNAVYGWARMLQTGQLRDENAVVRAKNAIVRNADMLMQLIDDLLDLSRITSGKMRLDLRAVDLPQILQAAVDAVRPAAEAKSIRLRNLFDPGVGPIQADPGRIQQVVWNLLVNAVKFTPAGGRVELRLDLHAPNVRIVVEDSGQGIAEDVLQHVFERFRQGDSSSTRAHGGLGLGLSLVKHLVELHGGSVCAQSDGPGHGATFTVELPAVVLHVPAEAPPFVSHVDTSADSSLGVRLDGVRVVVVDDDDEGLALAELILSRAGADVRSCATADAAVRLVRQWRPDVLVSDIEMPEEDGYSLIQKVRAFSTEDGRETPAIALTGYGRAEDRARAIAAGFNMHVPKPVDPGELTTIVAAISGVAERSGSRG